MTIRFTYRIIIICLQFLLSIGLEGQSTIYNNTGQNGGQTSTPPVGTLPSTLSSASNFVRGSGLVSKTVSGCNCIGSTSWTTAASRDANDYYEFSVTPATPIDISNILFTVNTNNTAPTSMQVSYKIGSGTETFFSTVTGIGNGTFNYNLSLSPVIIDATQPVTFRIYAYNAQNATGHFNITGNVQLAPTGLPVELIRFGVNTATKPYHIEWFTASERDIDMYTVQLSYDGIHWSDFKSVRAFNQLENQYSLPWNSVIASDIYLRLAIREFNGSIKYSSTVFFENPNIETQQLFSIYDQDLILHSGSEHELISLVCSDISGKIIFQQSFTSTPEDQTLSLSSLFNTGGVYFIQAITPSGKLDSRKFVYHSVR